MAGLSVRIDDTVYSLIVEAGSGAVLAELILSGEAPSWLQVSGDRWIRTSAITEITLPRHADYEAALARASELKQTAGFS
jgi:hypothetical protein